MANGIDLSDEEIDLLVDGLDAIDKANASGDVMISILTRMLAGRNPELIAKIEREQESQKMAEQQKRRDVSDRCALAKAKLIAYRRQRNASDFGESENVARRGG